MYSLFPRCSQCSSGSKNIRKRYGLSVPLCIGLNFIFPKCSLVNMVLEFE